MKNKFRNSAGFSLMEVMIGLAIFSIGMLAIGTMLTQTTNSNRTISYVTAAMNLAEAQMEELKNQGVATTNDWPDATALTLGTNTDPIGPMDMFGDPVTAKADDPTDANGSHVPAGGFTRFWRVTAASTNAFSRTVTLTVSWRKSKSPDINTFSMTSITRGNGI